MQLTVDFAPSVLAKVVPQPITHTSPRIQSEYTGERGNLIPISGHRSSPNPITMENRTDNRYKSCLFNMLKNISSFSTYFTFKMCFWQQTGYFHIRYRITICLFALLLMGCFMALHRQSVPMQFQYFLPTYPSAPYPLTHTYTPITSSVSSIRPYPGTMVLYQIR